MPQTGTETAVISAPPEAVLAAVRKVIESKKYTLTGDTPAQITFVTRKTALNWALEGTAQVAAAGGGTQLTVEMARRQKQDQAVLERGALLDGVKFKKAAKKMVKEINAALSQG